MIPKVIHYCWFGGNQLPDTAIKCIESWRRFCPGYEIREWNESNFDVAECDYVREAYEAKKWAFVSDYARFKILHEEGGLYFDVDVEMVSPIDDIVSAGPFMGVEDSDNMLVNPGLGLGAEPGMDFYAVMLERYRGMHFSFSDDPDSVKTVVDYTTELLKDYGLVRTDEVQEVCGIRIYPKDYFNPTDMDSGRVTITGNTVSIHHYAATWVDSYSRFRGKVYQFLTRLLGKHGAEILRKFVGRK